MSASSVIKSIMVMAQSSLTSRSQTQEKGSFPWALAISATLMPW